MDAEVIIVGGGVVGLWTAYHLASRGAKTILLEQFFFPHTRGSSHGQSRITRTSYPEDEYAVLMSESHESWRKLEKQTGKDLLINTGLLSIFDMKRYSDEYFSMLYNLKTLGITHSLISGNDLEQHFPGLASDADINALYENEAGLLRADACTQALRDCFLALGGDLHEGEPVISLNPVSETRVEVISTKKTYVCGTVVLTCGAYINNLLSTVNFKVPVKTLKTEVYYWTDKSGFKYSLSNKFPALIAFTDPIFVYSIPSFEYPGLMKVCAHEGTPIDPLKRDKLSPEINAHDKQNFDRLKKCLPSLFPDIDGNSPAIKEVCMYTETPDKGFILDFHPKHKNIVIGAGFSGHGFKTSPSVGHILANMATGLPSPYPLEPFSLKRFSAQSKL